MIDKLENKRARLSIVSIVTLASLKQSRDGWADPGARLPGR